MTHRLLARGTGRATLVLAAAGLWLLPGCAGGDAPRPNVVLISIDTMRPDFLGCYGYEREVSPAIDAFAAGGTIFDDVTSASPWTLPSHASMLTGMYPSTHGVATNERALTEETLATWLQRAGYQTFAVVNTHNVGYEPYGLMRGFERNEWVLEMERTGGPIFNRAEPILQVGRKMLAERDAARPFFLFLHFYDVHTDFTPEPEWERMFVEPYDGDLTGVTMDLAKARNQVQRGQRTLTEADVRYLEQLYDAEIRTFDERLGVFFDYLDAEGLTDETLVVITSDHGEEYNEHGGLLHGRTHYQELVRIPLIVRGPGVPVGLRIAEPVHLVDVAPMIYGLTSVTPPEGMDGYDASYTWRNPGRLPELRFLFSEADHNNVVAGRDAHNIKKMVRLEDTVLHYDMLTGKKELYDLSADPFEQTDLAAQDPERVAMLFEKLQEFMRREGTAKDIGEVSEENREWLNQLGYGGVED